MAADRETPNPNLQPKLFTLSGRELACYRAGVAMGEAAAYQVAGENLRRLRDHQRGQLEALSCQLLEHPTYPSKVAIEAMPGLADGLMMVAEQFEGKSSEQRTEASRTMGQIATMQELKEARWRPPLRAWAMLTVAMVVATTVATLAAIYATGAGW